MVSGPGGSGLGGVGLVRGGLVLGGWVWSRGGMVPGGCLVWGGVWSGGYIPAYTNSDPPPPVDRQTPVKILPWPNFVAAGNK